MFRSQLFVMVTVPGHAGDDLNPNTLRSILKQAGYKRLMQTLSCDL